MVCRAGMFVYALSFLLGVVIVQQLPVLLQPSQLFFLILCCTGIFFLTRYLAVSFFFKRYNQSVCKCYIDLLSINILLILLGIVYATIYADLRLDKRIDDSLVGQDIIVSGRVSSIPVSNNEVQRLQLDVESHRLLKSSSKLSNDKNKNTKQKFPERLRLSWYYGKAVKAGERWQLEVRLKPPHGFVNPGGFDYEGWLFQQDIHATGYVRKSALNQRLQPASTWSIDHIRQSLSQQIDAIVINSLQADTGELADSTMALVKALAIGEKTSLSNRQWQVLVSTGTSHLMAISGLHIGLAAFFAYALVRRIVPVYVMQRIPAQHVALLAGMGSAFLYALIAGLSIPTQRAIIMLFVLSLMMLIRRNNRPMDTLGLAMILILLIDPTAVLSAGFWFSFSAVAVIFISVMTANKSNAEMGSWLGKIVNILKHWLRLQLIISLCLLPLSLFMFQQVSLVSPLANLLLIPYVSFLVVPVILLAISCAFLLPAFAQWLFNLAASLLDFIWPALLYLSKQPYALWVRGDVDIVELLLACMAILMIFFSVSISCYICKWFHLDPSTNANASISWLLRFSVSVLFIPLFINNHSTLNSGEYQLTILDVGQGSAAVIQTQNHVVVFDTGAKFSDKMDAGRSVVIPYLRSQGVTSLDRLIISHGDADHIGGAQAIVDEYSDVDVIGQDIDSLVSNDTDKVPGRHCYAGDMWHWDGVDFEFISPRLKDSSLLQNEKRNNRSCVLRISSAVGSILLTGDIEKQVENQLLKSHHGQLQSNVLIVPHHGSDTSSSLAFLHAVKPIYSVFSVGYKNRYKLPASAVMQRYQAINSEIFSTDNSGAITLKLLKDIGIVIELQRKQAAKYWHHQVH